MTSKVSIIIPTYNNEKTIGRAIMSAQDQSYKNIEIIVIDNGSTDATINIVNNFSKDDSRIIFVKSEHGRSKARNKGLQISNGNYIQFLDSDDTISTNTILVAVEFLDTNTDFFAYATGATYIDDVSGKKVIRATLEKYHNSILGNNIFPINSLVFRNNISTYFVENIEYDEDWLFWASNLFEKSIKYSSEFGVQVHITGFNTTNQHSKMLKYAVYVRSIIKSKFKYKSLRLFWRDVHLAVRYKLLINESKELNKEIEMGKLKFEILLITPFFNFRFMRNYFQKKLNNSMKHNIYLDLG